MGKCPECGTQIGPMAIIASWDNWGKFICPNCGNKIRFSTWLLAAVVLMALMVGAERVLHLMLISHLSLALSFLISFILAMLIMFLVPMIWRFKKENAPKALE